MSPLRWEVLGLAFVLALPVLAMGLRGDLTLDDVVERLPWCLAAAWAVVALLAAVARPRPAVLSALLRSCSTAGARARPQLPDRLSPEPGDDHPGRVPRLLRCSPHSCGATGPQEHEEHHSRTVRAGGPPASR